MYTKIACAFGLGYVVSRVADPLPVVAASIALVWGLMHLVKTETYGPPVAPPMPLWEGHPRLSAHRPKPSRWNFLAWRNSFSQEIDFDPDQIDYRNRDERVLD
ncbi:MAG TPA: hypothetical protein VI913_00890 [Candidatus Peribacteraceae bacterium]|nr:hypothetical protein [Candidatus Peribacteraceae bacterium]